MGTILWYVGAGFLLGWVISTLTEWLWFRGRRGAGAGGQMQTAARTANQGEGQAANRARPVYPAPDYQPCVSGSESQAPSVPVDRPDPLSDIRGIGDVYEQRLYEAGVFTWHELAQVDAETLQEITRALPSSSPASWIAQARRLAAENGRIGATYTGPVPDDLTRIAGIDQVFEQELMRGGIVTFAQLAQATPQRLAEIIPAHGLDDAIDFAGWIAKAGELQAEGGGWNVLHTFTGVSTAGREGWTWDFCVG